jgi:hypothetical protein
MLDAEIAAQEKRPRAEDLVLDERRHNLLVTIASMEDRLAKAQEQAKKLSEQQKKIADQTGNLGKQMAKDDDAVMATLATLTTVFVAMLPGRLTTAARPTDFSLTVSPSATCLTTCGCASGSPRSAPVVCATTVESNCSLNSRRSLVKGLHRFTKTKESGFLLIAMSRESPAIIPARSLSKQKARNRWPRSYAKKFYSPPAGNRR